MKITVLSNTQNLLSFSIEIENTDKISINESLELRKLKVGWKRNYDVINDESMESTGFDQDGNETFKKIVNATYNTYFSETDFNSVSAVKQSVIAFLTNKHNFIFE